MQPVLDGLGAAIFIVDENRRIVLVNQAGTALFGDNLAGRDFVQAVRHPEVLNIIDRVLENGVKRDCVITLKKPVRTTFKVNVVQLETNTKQGAVVSFENISHVREAELMRSEFVANVSHELRSPLTALNGFIETLKGSAKDDAKAREKFLGIMGQEAKRMDRLIGDLLSLSKVEADQHVRPDGKAGICAIIRQVITILMPLATQENVKLNLDIDKDINDSILGDGDQLSQVFLNLIENAIKYGGSNNKVSICISNRGRAPGIRGPVLVIAVTDQGAGIAPEHLPRLTERFYRIDSGRSREKGGTGLGLAIVKHILARHRGRLQIKSKLGTGSTFTVFLPL